MGYAPVESRGRIRSVVGEDSGIRVMASQGYSDEFNTYQDTKLPADIPALDTALTSGQPQINLTSDTSSGGNGTAASTNRSILKNGKRQIIVPIRREDRAIGVLILESLKSDPFPEELLSFLSRLTDHAAIAIANAQLYSEVETANIAKSDFVSLVSHELKTPMTSIKGFTDLLAAGMVGPVNPAQSNFLNTIRTNVDRMATLVSDLTDISRIEAGSMRLEFEAIGVPDVVNEVVHSTHNQIDEKQQTLVLNVAEDLPRMWGDRSRIVQVLMNLVSNAYKYTPPEGQIAISAELAPNSWDLEGAPQVIHLAVEDTGYGSAKKTSRKSSRNSSAQMTRKVPRCTWYRVGFEHHPDVGRDAGGAYLV